MHAKKDGDEEEERDLAEQQQHRGDIGSMSSIDHGQQNGQKKQAEHIVEECGGKDQFADWLMEQI